MDNLLDRIARIIVEERDSSPEGMTELTAEMAADRVVTMLCDDGYLNPPAQAPR